MEGSDLKKFQAEQLRAVLSMVHPLSDETWDQFQQSLTFQVLEKNEFFLKAGDISTKLAFIRFSDGG